MTAKFKVGDIVRYKSAIHQTEFENINGKIPLIIIKVHINSDLINVGYGAHKITNTRGNIFMHNYRNKFEEFYDEQVQNVIFE